MCFVYSLSHWCHPLTSCGFLWWCPPHGKKRKKEKTTSLMRGEMHAVDPTLRLTVSVNWEISKDHSPRWRAIGNYQLPRKDIGFPRGIAPHWLLNTEWQALEIYTFREYWMDLACTHVLIYLYRHITTKLIVEAARNLRGKMGQSQKVWEKRDRRNEMTVV